MPAARRSGAGAADGLTVAVTGPTGEIGKPFIAALERAAPAPEARRTRDAPRDRGGRRG
jgi:hypothetical protein